MDATVTTGSKDLKIYNSKNFPILLTCIVDETAKTATVNVYGPPVKYTVKFTTALKQNRQPPAPIYHYNETAAPDGTPIEPNQKVEYVSKKPYLEYYVYKQHFDKDGKAVDNPQLFTTTIYQAYPEEYYCNYSKSGPKVTASPVS